MAKGRAYTRIEVTQEDIDNATPQDSRHCAIADALMRNIGALRVSVDTSTIRYSLAETDKRYVFLTPGNIQDYIIAFDAGDRLEPFSFTLGRPVWTGSIGHRAVKGQRHFEVSETTDKGTQQGLAVHVDRASAPRRKATTRSFGMRRMRINARDDLTPRIK